MSTKRLKRAQAAEAKVVALQDALEQHELSEDDGSDDDELGPQASGSSMIILFWWLRSATMAATLRESDPRSERRRS